jgi:hypothetical protein
MTSGRRTIRACAPMPIEPVTCYDTTDLVFAPSSHRPCT